MNEEQVRALLKTWGLRRLDERWPKRVHDPETVEVHFVFEEGTHYDCGYGCENPAMVEFAVTARATMRQSGRRVKSYLTISLWPDDAEETMVWFLGEFIEAAVRGSSRRL